MNFCHFKYIFHVHHAGNSTFCFQRGYQQFRKSHRSHPCLEVFARYFRERVEKCSCKGIEETKTTMNRMWYFPFWRVESNDKKRLQMIRLQTLLSFSAWFRLISLNCVWFRRSPAIASWRDWSTFLLWPSFPSSAQSRLWKRISLNAKFVSRQKFLQIVQRRSVSAVQANANSKAASCKVEITDIHANKRNVVPHVSLLFCADRQS